MNSNLFDDAIKQSIEGHEAAVPPNAWNNIAGKKRKRRYGFFWLLFAGLIAGGSGVFIWQKNHLKASDPIVAQKEIVSIPDTKIPSSGADKIKDIDASITQETLQGKENSVNDNTLKIAKKHTDKASMAMTVTQGELSVSDEKGLNKENVISSRKDNTEGKGRKNIAGNLDEKLAVEIVSANADATPDSQTNLPEAKELQGTTAITETVINDKSKTAVHDSATAKKTEPDSLIVVSAKKIAKELKKSTAGKWRLEGSIMPMLSFSNYNKPLFLQRTIADNDSRSVFTSGNIKTTLSSSAAFTVAAAKSINKRFTIGTGIQYLQLKEKFSLSGTDTVTNYNVVKRLVSDPVSPFLINDTLAVINTGSRTLDAQNSYTFFTVPVFMQYTLKSTERFSLAFTAGLNFNISAKYKNSIAGTITRKYSNKEELPGNKSAIGVGFFTGLRASTALTKNLDVFAAPMLIYTPGKYDLKNAVLNKRVTQAGLSLGISFKIK